MLVVLFYMPLLSLSVVNPGAVIATDHGIAADSSGRGCRWVACFLWAVRCHPIPSLPSRPRPLQVSVHGV